MGDLENTKSIAKYCTRLRLGFSKTKTALTIKNSQIKVINDIVSNKGCVMTDGCGYIGIELAKQIPHISQGRVIKCYDGDTITIATYLPIPESPLYKFSVRLSGIDCPEIRGKTESEKTCAKIAKKFIEDKLLGNIVKLKNVSLEKYGRILADVVYNGENLGDLLVDNRLAVRYDGGTKNVPNDWMRFHVTE